MRISELIKREEYLICELDESTEFKHLTTDLADVDEEDILVVPNDNKPLDFSMLKTNPLAVICGINTVLPDNIPAIRVSNPRIATANAFYRYENPSLEGIRIIGVTGTNGKTTTATIIKEILSKCGYKVGFIGTGKIEIEDEQLADYKYSMTTPDPELLYRSLRQMRESGCDIIVMEVSSHALALDKLAPLRFTYGVFTNLSNEHLDFHKDMESYFKAKCKLLSACECAVFNIDDRYFKKAHDLFDGKKISAGILWRGDVYATNIESKGFDGSSYIYQGSGFSYKAELNLPGSYNVYNAMLASAVCIDFGCRPCDVKRILRDIPYIPGRYEIIKDEVSVIIDYAHTALAFESIMKELCINKGQGSLTVVFGCGGNRDRSKRPMMAAAAEKYADRIIVTTDNPRTEDPKDIISDIIRGFNRGSYEIKESRRDAITYAITQADKGDIVAIIGKGPERYNIDKNGYSEFNEKEIVLEALSCRRGKKKCE